MAKRWYVVHAYSGMEKSVGRALQERVDRSGMQDMFGKILVPTEEVVEMKNGQRTISERRFFPGYVLVEMERELREEPPERVGHYFRQGDAGRTRVRPGREVVTAGCAGSRNCMNEEPQ